MRVVKQRLIEMLPDAAVFLDVDDLAEGKGAEYVDVSQISLIFVSPDTSISENCMRELQPRSGDGQADSHGGRVRGEARRDD